MYLFTALSLLHSNPSRHAWPVPSPILQNGLFKPPPSLSATNPTISIVNLSWRFTSRSCLQTGKPAHAHHTHPFPALPCRTQGKTPPAGKGLDLLIYSGSHLLPSLLCQLSALSEPSNPLLPNDFFRIQAFSSQSLLITTKREGWGREQERVKKKPSFRLRQILGENSCWKSNNW